ncbi:methyltransferase type 11 [Georgenia subflava]|uniref:Methyltransferase type 11 n=2 Tax=Georgenia subflava TaxID=1622177 RepID=A0A6N7EK76_9MICO|nr:methyltransferase type 11 [Georgenia subflava]
MRRLLVESPTSLGARARLRRWDLFRANFPDVTEMSVLDLGGTVESWQRAPVTPRRVTVLNLFEPGESRDDSVVPVAGDACAARSALESAGSDTSFDLVFSNSLLEHVGGHARRVDLAREIDALAPRHWVQTPYRYFPVEPHWLFPGMQFAPTKARVAIARHWPLVHTRPKTYEGARSSVLWTELVGVTEMQAYFPSSTILRERLAGLPKSLIAVR